MKSQRKLVLFIMLPYHSHYNASFAFANVLRNNGYDIVYSTVENVEKFIIDAGFLVKRFNYSNEFDFNNLKVFFSLIFHVLYDKSFKNNLVVEYREEMNSLDELLEDINPDIIALDDTLSHYYINLKLRKFKIIVVSTKLSPYRHVAVPPIVSGYIFKSFYLNVLLGKFTWEKHLLKRRIARILEEFVLGNASYRKFVEEELNNQGINYKMLYNCHYAFYDGIKNCKHFIFATETLEYPWKGRLNEEIYVSLKISRSESELLNKDYMELKNSYLVDRKNKINIYVSLGTIIDRNDKKIFRFFEKILQVPILCENVQIFVSTGGVEVKSLKHNPNVHLRERFPQLDLLNYIDIFLTHGGLNSLQESLQAGVPMIVYPLNKRSDQPGNGARIKYHRFGLVGDLGDNLDKIVSDIHTISKNKIYKENIARFNTDKMLNQKSTPKIILNNLLDI